MRRRALAGLAAIFLLVMIPTHGLCREDRYTAVQARVQAISASGYARVEQIGRSVEDRPIYSIFVTNPGSPEHVTSERARVLFICGQHGDESSSVRAMTALAGEMSHPDHPLRETVLSKALVAIVPVVNPDGYSRFRRLNARGCDLNRDWSARTQPETQAIARLVSDFRPQVIIDEHEWLDDGPTRRTSVEAVGYGSTDQHRLARLLATTATHHMALEGVRLGRSTYSEHSNRSLAHRYFTDTGVCSMLVETTPDLSPGARALVYREFAENLLQAITAPEDPRIASCLGGLRNSHQSTSPRIAVLYAPKPHRSQPHTTAAMAVVVILALLTLVARTRSARRDSDTALIHNPRVRPIAPAVTDLVELSTSPRERVAILRQYRRRPTDRENPMRKRPLDTPVLVDPFANEALGRPWDAKLRREVVYPTPSPHEKRLAKERVLARYLSNPDVRTT